MNPGAGWLVGMIGERRECRQHHRAIDRDRLAAIAQIRVPRAKTEHIIRVCIEPADFVAYLIAVVDGVLRAGTAAKSIGLPRGAADDDATITTNLGARPAIQIGDFLMAIGSENPAVIILGQVDRDGDAHGRVFRTHAGGVADQQLLGGDRRSGGCLI